MNDIKFPANKFEQFMVDSIKGYDDKTLVYVDGDDLRTAIAVKEFVKFNSSKLVLLGNKKIIGKNLIQVGLKSGNLEIIEPKKSEKYDDYVQILIARFTQRKKEITEGHASDMVSKTNYYASLMLKTGDAQGGVTGSLSPTEAIMRPLIQVIGTGNPKRYLSGASILIIPIALMVLTGSFYLQILL